MRLLADQSYVTLHELSHRYILSNQNSEIMLSERFDFQVSKFQIHSSKPRMRRTANVGASEEIQI